MTVIAQITADAESKMKATVEHAQEDFAAIRTGRAHPAMLNKITADYYGAPTPLQQLATFQIPEARTIMITPFDRSAMTAIEKAIRDSDLGANPSNDGNVIRVTLPALTEDRRKDYTKLAKHKAEEARVAARNIRRTAIDQLKKAQKDKEISEDDLSRAEKNLDVVTKKYTDQIDELLKGKEAELLEV
ncbi:ribosome recycling factor [Tessaracoccus sp. SD287]|uniref:ribosome recycling factor n=1 Tax=Tessaracoccus sp. SD287 TaxID=2782008 RepID=UPI001F60FD4B|nr:ribosome recycling factor [Tessaracoccus sp. SD287]